MVWFSERQTSFLFGHGGSAEPVGSADGSQCLCLFRDFSLCLPHQVLCPGPSAPPHKCSAEQGIRFWQHSWDFGGHSTVDNSAQPPGQDRAGPRSGAAVSPGSLFGWPRGRSGRSAAAWPSHAEGTAGEIPSGNGLGGGHVPGQAAPAQGGRRFVCGACECLQTRPALEPAGSCPRLKGPASCWLSKASITGSSFFCPARRQAGQI